MEGSRCRSWLRCDALLRAAIPLSDVGDLDAHAGASRIMHRDKQRTIEVTADIATKSLIGARKIFDSELAKIHVPPRSRWSGSAASVCQRFLHFSSFRSPKRSWTS